MSTNVVDIKGTQLAPRNQRASMETIVLTPDVVSKWLKPPFQRPLKMNAKVQKLAAEIKQDELIPGVITLGRLKNSTTLYYVDGQHRLEAFKMSGLVEAIVDVRIMNFENMAEMAMEYVELNSDLVKMGPDDILRGLESSSKVLRKIRAECGYVGYDSIRRNDHAPIVGMSQLLRCWAGSAAETPVSTLSGQTAASIAMDMPDESLGQLLRFMHLAFEAWTREHAYRRLWSALNMTMSMWLYRRMVLDKQRGQKRYDVLTDQQFRQCLMALSADSTYLDWLPQRIMSERDRSACYSHFRRIFARRMINEGNSKPMMPAPPWAAIRGRGRDNR